jgi:hypothetical protein
VRIGRGERSESPERLHVCHFWRTNRGSFESAPGPSHLPDHEEEKRTEYAHADCSTEAPHDDTDDVGSKKRRQNVVERDLHYEGDLSEKPAFSPPYVEGLLRMLWASRVIETVLPHWVDASAWEHESTTAIATREVLRPEESCRPTPRVPPLPPLGIAVSAGLECLGSGRSLIWVDGRESIVEGRGPVFTSPRVFVISTVIGSGGVPANEGFRIADHAFASVLASVVSYALARPDSR